MNHLIRLAATLALATQCLGSAQAALFHVTVDTSALATAGTPPAPFAIDFQLTGGSPAGNTALVRNIRFGGGSASGSATTIGQVIGSLAASVSLDSTGSFFNEFFQTFSAGTALSFDLDLSTVVNTPTPDAFALAILDANLANISTTDGAANALVHIDIDASAPSVQTFAGLGRWAGVTATVSAVPEPASYALVGMALALAGLASGRRRRQA